MDHSHPPITPAATASSLLLPLQQQQQQHAPDPTKSFRWTWTAAEQPYYVTPRRMNPVDRRLQADQGDNNNGGVLMAGFSVTQTEKEEEDVGNTDTTAEGRFAGGLIEGLLENLTEEEDDGRLPHSQLPTDRNSSFASSNKTIVDISNNNNTAFHNNTTNNNNNTIIRIPTLEPTIMPSVAPTTPNITSPPRDGLIESTDTIVLRNTIQIYGPLYLLMTLLFCLLRKWYPRLYNVRSWVVTNNNNNNNNTNDVVSGKQQQQQQHTGPLLLGDCEIARTALEWGWFSWMWQVFDVDEDDILEQCGMDALCFIRVLRIGRKLALVGCFHACWLIPVYATAEESEETYYLEDTLVLISTAHLPSGSPRFLATVICAYTIFGYTMWLLQRELEWYTHKRHLFLSQRRPRNYAVYVAGIPEHLRSDAQLEEFFRQSGATSSVLEAHVTLACPELEALVERRQHVQTKLEHARAYEAVHGARATKLGMNLWGISTHSLTRAKNDDMLDNTNSSGGSMSTTAFKNKLEVKLRQLTKDIAIAYQDIIRSNDPYSLEEHRIQVMQHMAELRKEERELSIVNRVRTASGHDLDHVEEIYHTADGLAREQQQRGEDKFSKGAEDFFFGPLSPSMQRSDVRNAAAAATQRVRIHTCDNSVYSYSMTDTPSLESESEVFSSGFAKRTGNIYRDYHKGLEQHPVSPSSSDAVTEKRGLLHRLYPTKSTTKTIPGTQNTHHDNTDYEWARNSSFESSLESATGTSSHQYHQTVHRRRHQRDQQRSHQMEDDSQWSVSDSDGDSNWKASGSKKREHHVLSFKNALHGVKTAGRTVVGAGAGTAQLAAGTAQLAGDLGVKGVQTVAGNLSSKVQQAAEMGVGNLETIRASAAAVVPMGIVLSRKEGVPLEAGFVVFKDLYSTQAALQMLHHPEAGSMRVSVAPGRGETFWANVGMPGSALRTGRLLSLAATVTLCLFWTVPISFISALTEVNSLKEKIPFLGEMVEENPSLEVFLALIAPLLLLILQDVFLPSFLEWFSSWEGHISVSTLESAVFVKYAAFVLVQTFFVSAISGSIAAELQNMLDEPEKIIDFLANALPAQSNYFLQILVVALVVTMGLEMLRVTPLALALARKFVGPNLTEKERRKRWKFFSPLEDPYRFEHANVSGSVVLYFMVFFVYSCLAPVSNFFLLVMFFLMESGYRYQLYNNYPPTPDSGGQHWIGFFHILLACMVVAELTLLGFLLLKQSFYAVPFLVPLLVFSCLFIYYLNNYQLYVAKQLPTSTCIKVDKERLLNDFSFAKGVYLQPCIKEAQSDDIVDMI